MQELSVHRPLFGGEVEIVLEGALGRAALDVIDDAYQEGLRLQRIFNFFDEKSALSRLNRTRRVAAPKELLEVLSLALPLCERTHGKYDISLGKQFLQRKKKQRVTPLSCSYKDILIQGDDVELLHPDVMIDLGSIAKGYIADRMVDVLKAKGALSGLIDARGDIRVFGKRAHVIGVQHPREPEQNICCINLINAATATSGDYNQYHGTFDTSHILHAERHMSVTVVAPTLAEADGYATALFVASEEDFHALLKNAGHIKVLCIDKDIDDIHVNDPQVKDICVKKYNGFDEVI